MKYRTVYEPKKESTNKLCFLVEGRIRKYYHIRVSPPFIIIPVEDHSTLLLIVIDRKSHSPKERLMKPEIINFGDMSHFLQKLRIESPPELK